MCKEAAEGGTERGAEWGVIRSFLIGLLLRHIRV